MSSRRKGKPQQRRDLDSVEPEQDVLTCGDCQRDFALGDIVRFIHHKVLRCDKEKLDEGCGESEPDRAQSPDTARPSILSNHRTSISAPIAQRRLTGSEIRDKSKPGHATSLTDSNNMTEDDRHEGSNEERARPHHAVAMDTPEDVKPRCIDAEANTICTEPTKFTCGTCKKQLESAWALLQHAQNDHGLPIYIDEKTLTPRHSLTPTSSPDESPGAREKKEEKPDVGSSFGSPSTPRKHSTPSEDGHHKQNGHYSENNNIKHEAGEDTGKEDREPGQISSPASSRNRTPHSVGGSLPPLGLSTTPVPTSVELMSPPSPFMFRMPMGERHRISPHAAVHHHSAFPRPPHLGEFRMGEHFQHLGEHFQRMQAMGLAAAPPIENGLPFSPFDRHHVRPPITPIAPLGPIIPPTTPTESGQDFYSQQLRRLAGTNSPGVSPPRKTGLPFPASNTTPPAAIIQPSPPHASTPVADVERSPRSSHMGSPDAKTCEQCGKRFRFLSNLVVHRRSHSGEQPFKCPTCPQTYAKATKLKVHMKTHTRSGLSSTASMASSVSTSSEHSIHSGCSTPESKLSKMDLEEMLDSEDESDEEAAMEEARRLGAVMDEPTDLSNRDRISQHDRSWASISQHTPNDQSSEHGSNKDDDAEAAEDADDDLGDAPRDLSLSNNKKEDRASLLTEVMEHSGLGNIQQYSEAFKQALAESIEEGNKKLAQQEAEERERKMNAHSTSGSLSPGNGGAHNPPFTSRSDSVGSEDIAENGHSESESAAGDRSSSRLSTASQDGDLSNSEQYSKRIKLEHNDSSPYPHGVHESFFPRLWFPSGPQAPEFFMQRMFPTDHFGLPFHGAENGIHRPENLRLDHKPGSGLNHIMPVSVSAPSTPTCLPSLRKEHNPRSRNDTCEFCGKIFKNCSNLTVHRRSHTGEKPYKCNMCSYACAQSSKLTRHMKTHGRQGKDVYHCKFCNMPFSVPSTLEKHMRKCVEMHPGRHPAALAAAAMAAGALGQIPHTNHSLASSANSI